MVKKNKKKGYIIPLIGGILFVIAVLVIFVIPFQYTATEVQITQEPYNTEQAYTEKEPYTTTDCESEKIIYKADYEGVRSSCIKEECASYTEVCAERNWLGVCTSYRDVCSTERCLKYKKYCGLKIENKDTVGETFEIQLLSYDQDTEESKIIGFRSVLLRTSTEHQEGIDAGSIILGNND